MARKFQVSFCCLFYKNPISIVKCPYTSYGILDKSCFFTYKMGLLNSTYIIELLGRLHEGPRVISAHSRFRWHCPDHRRPLPRSPWVEWYCCCFLGMMIEPPVSVGWPAPGVLALKGEMACILYLGDAQWAPGIHFLFHI